MSRFHQRRTALLKQLAAAKPFVAASLCAVNRRCGNHKCKCAHGEPHTAHALTFKVRGTTKTIHVPKDLVPEVQQWVNEHKRIKKLIQAISSNSVAIVQRHVKASRAAARGKHLSQR